MKKILILLVGILICINLVSSAEVKAVKVSDLKEGDIIIDKDGNEILVTEIIKQEKEKLSINDYLRQKIYGLEENGQKIKMEKIVGSGVSGPANVFTGKVVSDYEKKKPNFIQRLINKFIVWKSNR